MKCLSKTLFPRVFFLFAPHQIPNSIAEGLARCETQSKISPPLSRFRSGLESKPLGCATKIHHSTYWYKWSAIGQKASWTCTERDSVLHLLVLLMGSLRLLPAYLQVKQPVSIHYLDVRVTHTHIPFLLVVGSVLHPQLTTANIVSHWSKSSHCRNTRKSQNENATQMMRISSFKARKHHQQCFGRKIEREDSDKFRSIKHHPIEW